MQLLSHAGLLELERPAVMGVLNVTPDSFYDGGKYAGIDAARAHARRMVEDGASIIDVGARSYGREAGIIDSDEELRRLIPVLEALVADALPVAISVDTARWRIARLAIEIGASIVNDCSGARDPFMFALAARTGAALVLMHNPVALNTGCPLEYGDVVAEVARELQDAALEARGAGVGGSSIVLDPGLEFGKQPHDDIAILTGFEAIVALGYPVLLAASRKHFLSALTGAQASGLLPASLAATALAVERGAAIVRTHDVAETVQFLQVFRPNAARLDRASGTSNAWTSTSNSPKQASSSRTRMTRSSATRKAASSA